MCTTQHAPNCCGGLRAEILKASALLRARSLDGCEDLAQPFSFREGKFKPPPAPSAPPILGVLKQGREGDTAAVCGEGGWWVGRLKCWGGNPHWTGQRAGCSLRCIFHGSTRALPDYSRSHTSSWPDSGFGFGRVMDMDLMAQMDVPCSDHYVLKVWLSIPAPPPIKAMNRFMLTHSMIQASSEDI